MYITTGCTFLEDIHVINVCTKELKIVDLKNLKTLHHDGTNYPMCHGLVQFQTRLQNHLMHVWSFLSVFILFSRFLVNSSCRITPPEIHCQVC